MPYPSDYYFIAQIDRRCRKRLEFLIHKENYRDLPVTISIQDSGDPESSKSTLLIHIDGYYSHPANRSDNIISKILLMKRSVLKVLKADCSSYIHLNVPRDGDSVDIYRTSARGTRIWESDSVGKTPLEWFLSQATKDDADETVS